MTYSYIFFILHFHFLTHENLTYLEYDDWGSSRKNKFICLLTSSLFHALQHIYIYIYLMINCRSIDTDMILHINSEFILKYFPLNYNIFLAICIDLDILYSFH